MAGIIADTIRTNNAPDRNTVLGLATGHTPVGVYRELIRLHQEEGLDFSNVVTLQPRRVLPDAAGQHPELPPLDARELLRPREHPAGEHPHPRRHGRRRARSTTTARQYEEAIEAAGGIDLQILGIGRTGHIGFNEPGSSRESRTRLITLDRVTRLRRRRRLLRRGERARGRPSPWAWARSSTPAECILLAFGEHKARSSARRSKAR